MIYSRDNGAHEKSGSNETTGLFITNGRSQIKEKTQKV
jgi:hypothetical protein